MKHVLIIYFTKEVHVRKPHESCSRIRAGEGSPKKKDIKQIRKKTNICVKKEPQNSERNSVEKH